MICTIAVTAIPCDSGVTGVCEVSFTAWLWLERAEWRTGQVVRFTERARQVSVLSGWPDLTDDISRAPGEYPHEGIALPGESRYIIELLNLN
jgi:hypothetical protein